MSERNREPGGAHPQRCARPDLQAELPEWTELSPQRRAELEEHAGGCPECGPGLAHLSAVEDWLTRQTAPRAAALCPSAEELYDYGRGPGARRISEPERLALRAHVSACAECAALVESLAQRPPAPLLFDGAPQALPEANARRRRTLLWIPLAAAAAVLAALLWRVGATEPGNEPLASARIRFPAEPALRGQSQSELLFPRDRVLLTATGPWSPLLFELAPRERATRYRLRLSATGGGAFEAGRELARWDSAEPASPLPAGVALAPGHYTWEAWAVVDGLDVELGRRDFEARLEPELEAELTERGRAAEPARSESILYRLHEQGFLGDARAFARGLPASPEREAYLARRPGR